MASRRHSAELGIRFDEARERLAALGVPKSTIGWIRFVLPGIATRLGKPVPAADIADVMHEVAGAVSTLRKVVSSAATSPRHAAAVARIDTSVFAAESPDDGTWPEVPDFASLVRLLALMVEPAAAEVHDQRRSPYVDLGGAVERLLWAVRRATDPDAQAFAATVRPVAHREAGNPFVDLATVTFWMASGDDHWRTRTDLRGAVEAYRRSHGSRGDHLSEPAS